MGLKPDFRLVVGDADYTARIRSRLMSITVTDNDGETADSLTLTLDDADNAIEAPRNGAVLSVSLGYAGEMLFHLGQFTVDECEPEGPPDILTVRASSADMRASLKAQKSRSFRDATIGVTVARIATDNGLEAVCAPDLAARTIAHIDQGNESDMHFLTRLGRNHGAVAAAKDGKLLFAPAATGVSASGKPLDVVTLDRAKGDLIRWRALSADRDATGTVRARWRDTASARTRYARAGSGDPVKTLRNTYPTQAAAKAAAEAELAKAGRAQNGIELEIIGRAEILAQTPINVIGLRPELSGQWITETAEHTADFTGAGFTTRITTRRKPRSPMRCANLKLSRLSQTFLSVEWIFMMPLGIGTQSILRPKISHKVKSMIVSFTLVQELNFYTETIFLGRWGNGCGGRTALSYIKRKSKKTISLTASILTKRYANIEKSYLWHQIVLIRHSTAA